jgi:hypothetical protein
MSPTARLAQCFLKQFHAVCLAGIGATLAMAAIGAHADSIKIGGTGTGLGAMPGREPSGRVGAGLCPNAVCHRHGGEEQRRRPDPAPTRTNLFGQSHPLA